MWIYRSGDVWVCRQMNGRNGWMGGNKDRWIDIQICSMIDY